MITGTASTTDNIQTLTSKQDTSKAASAQKALTGTFDDYLKMLTVQLQNQDPTDPMKAEQFTQQIATLSGVQQQVNTNTNLEKLITMFSASQLNNYVGYIGKQVLAGGNQGILTPKDGATFDYDLEKEADSVKVTITDATGRMVYNGDGTTFAGRNTVIWNGVNSTTGATEKPGVYTVAIVAKDASKNTIKSTTYTTGTVTSLDTKDGGTVLSIGDIQIPVDKVVSVRQA